MPGLRRARRVRAARDFAAVRGDGRTAHAPALMLGWRAAEDSASPSRFGFVVGKRVGNAVTRNLVKRRLRAIIAGWQGNITVGQTIIITARPAAATRSFAELEGDIRQLLRRAKLWQANPALAVNPPPDPQEGSS